MDYKEVIEYMRKESHKQSVNSEGQDAYIIAISAIQELQALHEQGFILERLKDIDFRKDVIEHINYYAYMGLQEELEEYHKLGTLEEVREAVEKQRSKKPQTSKHYYACLRCREVRSLRLKYNYCHDCGQHIDWSEEE